MSNILSFALPFAGCALMMIVCARTRRRSTPVSSVSQTWRCTSGPTECHVVAAVTSRPSRVRRPTPSLGPFQVRAYDLAIAIAVAVIVARERSARPVVLT